MRNDTINKTIQYQCTGSNGVENPATDVANVTVHCKSVLQLFCCYCCYFSLKIRVVKMVLLFIFFSI